MDHGPGICNCQRIYSFHASARDGHCSNCHPVCFTKRMVDRTIHFSLRGLFHFPGMAPGRSLYKQDHGIYFRAPDGIPVPLCLCPCLFVSRPVAKNRPFPPESTFFHHIMEWTGLFIYFHPFKNANYRQPNVPAFQSLPHWICFGKKFGCNFRTDYTNRIASFHL